MRRLSLVILAFFLVACGREPAAPETAQRAAAEGRWFISAANPYAVEAGASILRRGGSAVDAAIATQAVLGLVEPQSSGLGGGAFMLHYDPARDRLETYNGREWAPASATPDRFLQADGAPMSFLDAVVGGISVGVPGAVAMLEMAHGEHGKLPWDALFAPAASLAEEGFEVSPRLSAMLAAMPRLKQLPAAAEYFYRPNGAPHPAGHLLKNPAYAQTLQQIAAGGAAAFYEGPIAEMIVEAVNTAPNPGGMTLADLAEYHPTKVEPVCGPYRAYQVCSMAPPSSGGVTVLQILGLLEGFDIAVAGAHSVPSLHLLFEASKLAYADRNQYLADNEALARDGGLSLDMVVSGLLNPTYIKARAELIDPEQVAAEVTAGDPSTFAPHESAGRWKGLGADASPEPPSTSHFTIIDAEGRVVSMTTTVEFIFGSHLMAGGMILNNQLTDFSFLPTRDGKPVANAVGPRKRPRSSMSPVIIFDDEGRVWGAAGSPGGPAIIGFVAKWLLGVIDWGLTAQQAADLPNAVFPRGAPMLEAGAFDPQTKEGLEALGHELRERDLTSGIHAVRVLPNGDYDGAADSRREGAWLSGVVEVDD